MKEQSKLVILRKLSAYSSILSRINDLTTLALESQRILEQVVSHDYSGLYLFDPTTNMLKLLFAKGFSPEELEEAEKTAMDRHPGYVFRTKKILNIPDVDADAEQQTLSSARGFKVKSRLFIPVMNGEECVGTFGITSGEVNRFSEIDIEVLSFVCNAAGVVYGNILSGMEQDKSSTELHSTMLRLKLLVATMQEGILFEDEHRRVFIVNDRFLQLFNIPLSPDEMVGLDCDAAAEQSKGLFLSSDGFIPRIKTILQEKKHVAGEELLLKDGRVFERSYSPVIYGDYLKGHLWTYKDVTKQKSANDALYNTATRRKELLEITKSLISTLKTDEIIEAISGGLKKLFFFDTLALYQLDNVRKVLYPLIITGKQWISPELTVWELPSERGIVGDILNRGTAENVPNAHIDPRAFYPLGASVSIEHVMVFPLKVGDNIEGIIILNRLTDPPFSSEEFELSQFLITYASLSLYNARLFEQKTLRDEENSAILEAIPDLLLRFQPDGTILDMHSKAVHDSSFPINLTVGSNIKQRYPADTVEKILEHLEKVVSTHTIQTLECMLPTDAGLAHFEARMVPFNQNEVLFLSRNISERKRAEQELQDSRKQLVSAVEALRTSEMKYRKIFENVQDVFFQADMYGNIIEISPSIHRYSGFTREELIGMPVDSVYALKDDQRKLIRELFRLDEVTDFEIQLQTKDNRLVYTSVNAHFIYNDEGTLYGVEGSLRDITARKQIEQQIKELNENLLLANQRLAIERDKEKQLVESLSKLNQMKSEFVSSVSHELRTPLASIIGFAQTLLRDEDIDSETKREFITIIQDEGKRLSKLINDLLDLSRIESGKIILEKSQNNIIELITSAIKTILMQSKAKEISIETSFFNDAVYLNVDKDRIYQVVLNLLSNAVKFTRPKGTISIFVEDNEQHVTIQITDTGIGISKKDQEFLFQKFYRVHRPNSHYGGTGLGLAIAKQLIEYHGGTISVVSEENKGSQFIIRIPK